MRSRVLASPIAMVAAAAIGLAGALPVTSAKATSEPPFGIAFPQETSKTHFSSTFGASRSGGRRHKGNDLMAERMTEVYAAADGVVFDISVDRLGGRSIKISHADEWTSAYLHLNNDNPGTDDGEAPWSLTVAPGIAVGTEVRQGQLIGWVGDSGNAEWTAPHTHFELRRDGTPINPYKLLLAAYEHDLAQEIALVEEVEEHLRIWHELAREQIDLMIE